MTAVVGCALLLAQAGARPVPSRNIPVPDKVSERLRQNVARPLAAAFPEPKSAAEWKQLQDTRAADRAKGVPALLASLRVKMTSQTMGGVKVNDANVTAVDIVADNGVIHVIDSVILPN